MLTVAGYVTFMMTGTCVHMDSDGSPIRLFQLLKLTDPGSVGKAACSWYFAADKAKPRFSKPRLQIP